MILHTLKSRHSPAILHERCQKSSSYGQMISILGHLEGKKSVSKTKKNSVSFVAESSDSIFARNSFFQLLTLPFFDALGCPSHKSTIPESFVLCKNFRVLQFQALQHTYFKIHKNLLKYWFTIYHFAMDDHWSCM